MRVLQDAPRAYERDEGDAVPLAESGDGADARLLRTAQSSTLHA